MIQREKSETERNEERGEIILEKQREKGRKEGNILFNDALNTFYLRLYGVRHIVKDHSDSEREETRCCHMGYSFRLGARVLLYASSHRQDDTYHGLCYTSRGTLAGTKNRLWVWSRYRDANPVPTMKDRRERDKKRVCLCAISLLAIRFPV